MTLVKPSTLSGTLNYSSNTGLLFKNTGVLKLLNINVYNTALFMFKYYNKLLPDSCKNFIKPRDNNLNRYNFRHVHDFEIPRYRTTIREKFIIIQGPRIWDSLPEDLRTLSTISNFKNKLKRFLSHLVLVSAPLIT